AALASDDLDGFYSGFASLLSVQSSEIAFVENATRAWDMAFYALPLAAGDRVITHVAEYASNYLAFLHLSNRLGIHIDIASSDEHGQIDVSALPALMKPTTKVINLVHIPTQGGLVNPAEEVGHFARDHGLLYFLDACQSVGQLEVNVAKIGCHVLSGTGRKFLRGPRGTGFLYVSNEIIDQLDPPFIDMRAATWREKDSFDIAPGARRFENWESYVAGRIGLAAAVDYAQKIGISRIEECILHLAAYFRDRLGQVDGITIRDLGEKKCGIVTFESNRETAATLASRLRPMGVNISVTNRESAQLDFSSRGIRELARASVHYFNTETEIDRFCSLVAQ
ncbi:MAG: aminotransferase class V-fold PLP-dependent enzyme, partial [Woeseiaceae bacterium]